VAGVLALIVNLTQKLWERPTPKFSEAVASCDRASRRILIAGTELRRLGLSRWEETLAFQKKNGRCLGGPQIHKKLNFSLSAHVLQRKPLRQPAQKQAVILYANKRVKYDLSFRSTLS
jgi:hypothetical protein